ncbi:DinB family protein [uncultured Imperialibacter sp.]|uniref:DinB family protein n=1 Tax=uncultured Imperialibacter sp. TaxID=1672639 RepID=UPI0030D76D7E|tara:strand:- start:1734 stop:2081 length:348 start_codon:yes stop_codon:yes gene_type:complete
MVNTNRKLIEYLIQQLLELQNGKLWMGDNFERKINSISEQQAFTKPSLTLHSVAELVAHLAAWSDDLILKIKNGTGKLQDSDEQNWPDNEKLKKLGWNEIRRKYQDSLGQVIGPR